MNGLGGFGIVIIIIGILEFVGYVMACSGLKQTAADKGHEVNGFIIFIFGLPYMIYVASLPDLKARKVDDQNE